MEEKLRQELATVRTEIRALQRLNAKLEQKLAELLAPLRVGQKIQCDASGDVYRIDAIFLSAYDMPAYRVMRIKRNGKPSVIPQTLFADLTEGFTIFGGSKS